MLFENFKKLFEFEDQVGKEIYYLVKNFTGELGIGGPEKERMNDKNQYRLEWIDFIQAEKLTNLYPVEIIQKIIKLLK